MSRTQISKHYTRLANLWPTDRLRPEVQFKKLLRDRIQNAPTRPAGTQGSDESVEVNAAYRLLDNGLTKQHTLPPQMMAPASNPTYYKELSKELDEVPDRTWWGGFKKRLGNMVRWS
ncbi:hypothetical protein MBLNU230_g1330t1 [Neophaeotheca triangularis]